jgi:Uma2 family endonuclease
MATVPRILSYEEWLQMPTVEDAREEVVNGEIIFIPLNHYPHAEIIQRLITALVTQIDQKKVAVLGSDFGLMISREPLTCRSPDLALFHRQGLVIRDGFYWSAPELVIEVLSPSETRLRKLQKLADYAKIRVPEVWIVSPEARLVEIHLLSEGKLPLTEVNEEGNRFSRRFHPHLRNLAGRVLSK